MITSNKNQTPITSALLSITHNWKKKIYVEHPSTIQSTALLVFICFFSEHPTTASKATSNIFNKYIELEIENLTILTAH